MYCSLFTHSPVDENLGCFQFLAITNKAVMNICVQVFVCTYAFFSLGEIAGSKMAELYDVCIFNFLIKCQTLSQVAVPLYVTPSSVVIVSSSSSTCQHLLWSVFNFRCSNRWVVPSNCSFNLHFPMTNGMEHLCMYLFAIHTSSWVNCLLKYFVFLKLDCTPSPLIVLFFIQL